MIRQNNAFHRLSVLRVFFNTIFWSKLFLLFMLVAPVSLSLHVTTWDEQCMLSTAQIQQIPSVGV